MTDSKKARQQQLATEVRQGRDRSATAIKELLGLLIEDAKNNLVTSSGDATLRLQGEAQAIMKLHTMLTKEPASIARKGE